MSIMKKALNRVQYILIIFFIISCSPKIKTITAYENKNGILEQRILTQFDKKGNELKEIKFGDKHDKIKTFTYNRFGKVSVLGCNLQKGSDKCILDFFSKFSYNSKENIETETMYVKDSLVWLIKELKIEKRLNVVKTFLWENEATKFPNFNNAYVIIDSLYFDKKGRLIKYVSSSKINKRPIIGLYNYTDKGYSYKITGSKIDSLYNFIYTDEQKVIEKKLPKYQFYFPKELIYKIEYY